MTKLAAGGVVIRETAVSDRGRPIITELYPSHLVLRLKGSRENHFVADDAAVARNEELGRERIVSERLPKRNGRRQ